MQEKNIKIIHFQGGGEITVDSYEEHCCKEVKTFSGETRRLHKVRYQDGTEGFVSEEQVESVESSITKVHTS